MKNEHTSTFPFLYASDAEKIHLLHPSQQRLHKLRFLQKLGCQKPCWDQARLSSLVNKQVAIGIGSLGWAKGRVKKKENYPLFVDKRLTPPHIVSSKKFHKISSSPHWTLPNDNYDAPEEVYGERKLFDRPLKKWGQKQFFLCQGPDSL